MFLHVTIACLSDVVLEAIALPRDTSRQFFCCLGLELSASASPRSQRLLLEFASKYLM